MKSSVAGSFVLGCLLGLGGSVRTGPGGGSLYYTNQYKVMYYYENSTKADLKLVDTEKNIWGYVPRVDYFEMELKDASGNLLANVTGGHYTHWWAIGWLKDAWVPRTADVVVTKIAADGTREAAYTCKEGLESGTRTASGFISTCNVAGNTITLTSVPVLENIPIEETQILGADFWTKAQAAVQQGETEQWQVAIRIEGPCSYWGRRTVVDWGKGEGHDERLVIHNVDFPNEIPWKKTLPKHTTVTATTMSDRNTACVFTVGTGNYRISDIVVKKCELGKGKGWKGHEHYAVFTSMRVK